MRRRKLPIFAAAAVLLGIGCAVPWLVYQESGRTPSELIRHAQAEVQQYPRLERIVLPILNDLLAWFGEPEYGGKPIPFAVPALPQNATAPESSALSPKATPGNARAGGHAARDEPGIIRVGPGRSVPSIAIAARLAKDGDTVEIDAGDYHADVASWHQNSLTLRGVGGQVRLVASGAHAEGKAIWVIKGKSVTVENIEFVGARVPDRNGAGIRLESGQLIVRNCLFFDNENGIMTAGDGDIDLEIETSEFGYNGVGDGQSHGLYAGAIRSLKVIGSYFHHSNVGHLIKSRAATNYIAYNRFTDEPGGRASYELEFPNGGIAYVIGNIVQQGAQASNSTLVSYGAEGYSGSSNQLHLVHNTLVNDHPYGGAFLRVAPGAQLVRTRNNILVGSGQLKISGLRDSAGDIKAGWEIFAHAAREDYRLNAEGRKLAAVSVGMANGMDLTPHSEYVHPKKLMKLANLPALPGALQSATPLRGP